MSLSPSSRPARRQPISIEYGTAHPPIHSARYVRGVNLNDALARLPEAYAAAIRLRNAGHADRIADELQVPATSVEPLLRIADAKLADLLATPLPSRPEGSSSTSAE